MNILSYTYLILLCELEFLITVFEEISAGADPGVVRVVRSNPLKWNGNVIFTILFLWKKDLLKNNNN